MKLEVISRYPKRTLHPTPLLFIHGANSGAWVWDVHFLPYFARQGYVAHAVSLRGHGNSDGRRWLPWASLGDYVDDIAGVVDRLEQPPVLIGHSMGGMVIQKYLESREAPGAVLMASVPPHGLWLSSLHMAMRDPMLFWQIAYIQGCSIMPPNAYDTVRRLLFSKHMPEDEIRRYHPLWQPESHRVVLDMMWLDLPRIHNRQMPPMLVLGAHEDAFVPGHLAETTARIYGTTAAMFPDIAHAMMLEPNWRSVADHMLTWLEASEAGAGSGLASQAAA